MKEVLLRCFIAMFFLPFVSPWQARAEGWSAKVAPKAAPAVRQTAAPVQQAQAQAQPQPLQTQMLYLVRTSLLALNDANQTGNYTVLRDLSAPTFRERNSAADLAVIFSELRRSKLDLAVSALMTPEIEDVPALDADRRLHIKGSYATQPNRVVFDLTYEAVNGHWRLYGVTISTRPAMAVAATGRPAVVPAKNRP